MTTNKHASGDWRIERGEAACFHRGNSLSIVHDTEAGGETVSPTIAEVWPGDTADADARLIIAAPKLLAAAEATYKILEDMSADEESTGLSPSWVHERALLRAAIAEATNEDANDDQT
jgi:hypothetical protein